MKKIFFLFFLLISYEAFCQNLDSIKNSMIKAAVDFYATDEKLYIEGFKQEEFESNDTASILNYSKKLKRVKGLLDNWYKASNDKNSLKTLHSQILTAVFKWSYRDSLPSSKSFRSKMDSLLNLLSNQKNLHKVILDSFHLSNSDTARIVRWIGIEVDKQNRKSDIVAVVLCILLIGVMFYFYKKNNEYFIKINKTSIEINERIDKRKRAIEIIEKKVAEIEQSQSATNSRIVNDYESRIKKLENSIGSMIKQKSNIDSDKTLSQNLIPSSTRNEKVEPVIEKNKIFYAKFPDLNNGFSESILSENQDGEQILEIEMLNNSEAQFFITNNLKAQKYALSSVKKYLEKACEIINEPSTNSRIDTKKHGRLKKDGSDWIIVEKAIIEFMG